MSALIDRARRACREAGVLDKFEGAVSAMLDAIERNDLRAYRSARDALLRLPGVGSKTINEIEGDYDED